MRFKDVKNWNPTMNNRLKVIKLRADHGETISENEQNTLESYNITLDKIKKVLNHYIFDPDESAKNRNMNLNSDSDSEYSPFDDDSLE